MTALERQNSFGSEDEGEVFKSNFRTIITRAAPSLPPSLVRRIENNESSGLGKVKVILRVCRSGDVRGKHFDVDQKKRQVTLLDPSVGRTGEIDIEERKIGVAAPKMFAFDGVITDESQEDVAGSSLSDVISAVVSGSDGCVFSFGHSNLGQHWTMIGDDTSAVNIGVIPTAISWLFKSIKEKRSKTGARFSVRVSALEVSGDREECTDLLRRFSVDSDQSPGVYLSQGSALSKSSEIRASSVDKAAHYLDAALHHRSPQSHLVFSLSVYQFSVDKRGAGGVAGGRSRLHLIDFADFHRSKTSGGGLTLSGLGTCQDVDDNY